MNSPLHLTWPEMAAAVAAFLLVLIGAHRVSAGVRRRRIVDRFVSLDGTWARTDLAHRVIHETGVTASFTATWSGSVSWRLTRPGATPSSHTTTSGAHAEDSVEFARYLSDWATGRLEAPSTRGDAHRKLLAAS